MPTQDWTVNQGIGLANMRPELRNGVCSSLAYDWIRVSSTGMDYTPNLYGGLPQHVMSMQRAGKAFIEVGKTWQDKHTQIALRDGFTSVTWTGWTPSAPTDLMQFTLWDFVQAQIDLSHSDFVFLSLSGAGGGHAVAFKVNAAPYLFFDANSGQYSDANRDTLGAWANQYIVQRYPDLLASGFTGGFRGAAKAEYARPHKMG
jgi:hypothetical protein